MFQNNLQSIDLTTNFKNDFKKVLMSWTGPDEVTIKSEQLYNTLKSGKLKVMILDARPGKDYIESHINHPACISVPEECIAPGYVPLYTKGMVFYKF